jgi:hypothetical protein
MSTKPEILAADYNAIRSKVVSILGTGLGQRGYGQVVSSQPVVAGNEITADQWNALRNDLSSIRLHQEGVQPALAQINVGSLIQLGAGHPNTNYNTVIDLAVQTRFNIAASRSLVISRGTRNFSSEWSELAQATLTVTFDNSDDARYFFNSGGKIRFTSSRTGGAQTQQNSSWSNLLDSIGTFEFGANIPTLVNFYSLTDSFQTVFQRTPTDTESIYFTSGNSYKIEAKCNVANNVTGTANSIDFIISWIDNYEDPGNDPTDVPDTDDVVDGTLTLTIEELKASGPLIPSGSFTITSPSFSLSNITAT